MNKIQKFSLWIIVIVIAICTVAYFMVGDGKGKITSIDLAQTPKNTVGVSHHQADPNSETVIARPGQWSKPVDLLCREWNIFPDGNYFVSRDGKQAITDQNGNWFVFNKTNTVRFTEPTAKIWFASAETNSVLLTIKKKPW